MYCTNCNQILPDDSTFCNKCGHKVSESTLEISSGIETGTVTSIVSNNETSLNRKSKKKPIIISLVIIIIIAMSSASYWYYNDKQQKEEAAAKAAMIQKYQNDISEAVIKIVAYSYISEKITNLYSTVWSGAIKARYGIQVNGKKAYSFNEAIKYQREELEDKGILKKVRENTQSVDALMKSLNNPPEEFQKAYGILVEMYGNYTQFADQADSPTGSLIEFNKKTNELSAGISKYYNQFKILLPNLDESKINDYIGSQDI